MKKKMAGNQRQHQRSVSISSLVLTAYCLLLTTGCIRRNLTIRTEPPGATLIVNDETLGTTPHAWDFQWYGWYRITLLKDGYERLDDRMQLKAPIYFWIPLDLVMEVLPFPVRDDRALLYELKPKTGLPEPSPPITDASDDPSQEAQPTEEGDG